METSEITARFLKERQRWDQSVILTARDERTGEDVTIKTVAEEEDLELGTTYRWFGAWQNHHRWGKQFAAKTFIEVTPLSREGIVSYLQRAPHVGRAIAEAAWTTFQDRAVATLREQPGEVAAAMKSAGRRGFTVQRAEEAAAYLRGEAAVEAATIDLLGVLQGRGFPRATLKTALREWGNRAAEVVRRNPYRLMRFPGCGFARCDALYLELGLPPAALKRQTLSVWYAMSRDTSGSTWFDVPFVERAVAETIASAAANPVRACKLGIRAGLLATYRNGSPRPYITVARRATAEEHVAGYVRRMLDADTTWPLAADLDVSEHQREQLAHALVSPLGIFSGSPGTGKTFSAARLIDALVKRDGYGAIAVVAPTGKAAVRITEAMRGYGLDVRARTVHSYLKVAGFTEGKDGGFAFMFGPDNPVLERYVVVDEASMLDVELLASLMGALPNNGHLLLVGDTNQLAPVGHGAPLRDLIAAGVPNGELREIRRNSGAIVATCAKIRDQEPVEIPAKLDLEHGGNIMLAAARTPEETAQRIMGIVRHIRDAGLANATWETQVLVAINEKSACSRKELNRLLQAELNGQERADAKFWTGDKIICLSNQFLPLLDASPSADEEDGEDQPQKNDKDEVYVANGEIGRVIRDEPRRLIVDFPTPERIVIVPKGEDGAADKFDLGYAISGHKCVAGDTLVETNRGFVTMEQLPISGATSIATGKGPQAFCGYTKRDPEKLLRIQTEHGYEITVTPDHSLMVWDGQHYSKQPASEIVRGEFLRLKLGATCEQEEVVELPPAPSACRGIKYELPKVLDSDFAEFLGLMVADGTVWDKGFRLLKRYDDVADRFNNLVEKHFRCRTRRVSWQGARGYEVHSVFLARWLQAIGGLNPNKKAVPTIVLASGLSIQAAFLRGLFEDGTVNLRNGHADHIEFSTAKQEVAKLVQIMLLRLGIASTRKQRKNGIWSLYIYSEFLRRFSEVVGFVAKTKNGRAACCSCKCKFVVPVSRDQSDHFSQWARQNARCRGYVSRETLRTENPDSEALLWHHVRVKKISEAWGPSFCVTVPSVGRFLQNGFDGSNSQGSEWPVVIVALDDSFGARMVCDRSWIYTAISRAKKACILVGTTETIATMTRSQHIARRVTFLTDRIRKAAEKLPA